MHFFCRKKELARRGRPAPAPMSLGGGERFGSADGDGRPAEETGERLLKELERKDDKGELTPAERSGKLLPLKLEESLVKLAEAGGGQAVEVRVTLRDFSDETIAKLEALGFKVLAKATSVKLVIGTITAGKLKELALLEVVRHVAPAE